MRLRVARKILKNANMYWVGYMSVLAGEHIENRMYEKRCIRYFKNNADLGKMRKYKVNKNVSVRKAIKVFDNWRLNNI